MTQMQSSMDRHEEDKRITNELEGRIADALREVFDPEIPVNIYDLGLIYRLDAVEETGQVDIDMTLTAPGCPVAQTFPGVVSDKVKEVEGVTDCVVELIWDPPWTQDSMTDAVKLQLGLL